MAGEVGVVIALAAGVAFGALGVWNSVFRDRHVEGAAFWSLSSMSNFIAVVFAVGGL